MPQLTEIASTIQSARRKLGVSQEQAASTIGVTRLTWLRWEHAKNAPSEDVRPNLAAFLGVKERALTCETAEKDDPITLLIRGMVEREVEKQLRQQVRRARVTA